MTPPPKRIRLSRAKGWRMPANTVNVARPGRYGNPFKIGMSVCSGRGMEFQQVAIVDAGAAVSAFRAMTGLATRAYPSNEEIERDLRGKDVACWCRLCPAHAQGKPLGVECPDCSPCHGDVTLELANAETCPHPSAACGVSLPLPTGEGK